MIRYDFECISCVTVFEREFARPTEAPSSMACPFCGKTARRKLSTGVGCIFKGNGFYCNDYRKPEVPKDAT